MAGHYLTRSICWLLSKQLIISFLKVRQTIATGVESLVRIGLDKGHFCFRDQENTGRDIVLPGEVTFIE